MKRIFSLLLVLCLLLPLAACRDETIPDDYVAWDEIIIDNETPYVYVDPDTTPIPYTITDVTRVVQESWLEDPSAKTWSYMDCARYCGGKFIRHIQESDKDIYYTVYASHNYSLRYLFLIPDEEGTLRVDPKCLLDTSYDARETVPGILEQDQPAVILNGRLPDGCYMEDYSYAEIDKEISTTWSFFNHYCTELGLGSPFTPLWDSAQDTVTLFRCLYYVRFDLEEGGDGVYVYDVIEREDGTGTLLFLHATTNRLTNPYFETLQTETVPLTAEEITALSAEFDEWDFDNIPTWNPEEYSGYGGETTYILRAKGVSAHLIGMWSPSERYGIYHIRTAFEEIVREKITVTSGRVYTEEDSP